MNNTDIMISIKFENDDLNKDFFKYFKIKSYNWIFHY